MSSEKNQKMIDAVKDFAKPAEKGTLIVLSGLPSSGKSTFCADYKKTDANAYIASADNSRAALWGSENKFYDISAMRLLGVNPDMLQNEDAKYTAGENIISGLMATHAKEMLAKGHTVIYDSEAVTKTARENILSQLKPFASAAIVLFFDEDKNTCLARNKEKAAPLPENIIEKMSARQDFDKDGFDMAMHSNSVSPAKEQPQAFVQTPNAIVPGAVVHIFTDGSARSNPNGPGGWGYVIKQNGNVIENSKGYRNTTNNRMELTGVIEALKVVPAQNPIVVHSDSRYVVAAFNEKWLSGWIRRGWRTSAGDTVANKDLWVQLAKEADRHPNIGWDWVKGHAGHPENERCDELATSAADSDNLAIDTVYEQQTQRARQAEQILPPASDVSADTLSEDKEM